MSKKVLVALSGGVDSYVSALILKKKGFEVAGIVMSINTENASLDTVERVKNLCKEMKIKCYVIDVSEQFKRWVINKFISEYRRGRTPNPCVYCNKHIKFGLLLREVKKLKYDFLATGHYAKIEKTRYYGYVLKKSRDELKDQTYFLYAIRKKYLKHIMFPLGEFTKDEVVEIARRHGYPLDIKNQSQDICFIPHKDYRSFLLKKIKNVKEGPIFHINGQFLGKHKGIIFYTVGQRQNIGISYKEPLYVLSIDADKNAIIVGEKKHLKSQGLIAQNLNLLVDKIPPYIYAKIRYAHRPAKCKIDIRGNKAELIFEEPQEAITPGQAVVFYYKDIVLGGGIIKKSLQIRNKQ